MNQIITPIETPSDPKSAVAVNKCHNQFLCCLSLFLSTLQGQLSSDPEAPNPLCTCFNSLCEANLGLLPVAIRSTIGKNTPFLSPGREFDTRCHVRLNAYHHLLSLLLSATCLTPI